MGPTVCVVCGGTTNKMIANVLAELQLPANFVFRDTLINDESEIDADLAAYDVIFSSGNNAHVLRRFLDTPVISISLTMYDVLIACSKARQYTAKPLLITHREAFSDDDLNRIANVLSIEIVHEKYVRTDNGIEEILLRGKAAGHECVIGAGLVCEFAEKHGMRGIYLFPDESIRRSLVTASDMAVSIFQKTAENLRLTGVIDNSKTGIVMLNGAGKVFLSNPMARRYLGMGEKELAGMHASGFLDPDAVRAVMESASRTRFFKEFRGSSYSVEAASISNRGEVTDRLLFIEDLNVIRNTEQEFRREVWAQKGFVAKYSFADCVSEDQGFRSFLSIAKSFARTEEPVVILGETGVGKEVIAQSIHNHSPRAGRAFVAVNCAAIPDNLLESELFGYSDGAFTGAKKGGKEGYFEMAHTGTVFLDEIGEMNLQLQSKLLRVIQEKQVLRVGATKLTPFDARIIVATNRNLWQLVEDGAFRKDLYYRLNVLELEVPPLRERSGDTLMLFKNFAGRLSPPMLEAARRCGDELGALLASYPWPGNVRELENFVHMLAAHWHAEMRPEVLPSFVAGMLGKKRARCKSAAVPSLPAEQGRSGSEQRDGGRFGLLRNSEERQIREALEDCGGNVEKAAKLLGIHRTTLWRKMRRHE